jgi:GWxTD domain-containing protein
VGVKRCDLRSFILLPLLLFNFSGQVDQYGAMSGAERGAAFDLSVRQVFDEENKSILVVSTSIPYNRLVFFLRDERYVANYRVFMELRPKKGRGIRGEVWEEIVTADSFQDTRARGALSVSKRSFGVEPGEYVIKLSIEVVDTSLRFRREKDIRIVGHGQKTLVVSEPAFMVPGLQGSEGGPAPGEMRISLGGGKAAESYSFSRSPTYHGLDVWARITCSVVGPFTGEGLAVAARVTDFEGRVLLYNHRVLKGMAGGHLQLHIDMGIDRLPLGVYKLEMSAAMPDEEIRAHSEGSFNVLFTRSSFYTDFNKTLELLSIIAREKDLDELRNVEPEERYAAWQRFWLDRDTALSSESNVRLDEFYARLIHVMRNFSVFRPGWQTDRGLVFIRHGKPDKITESTTGFGRNYRYWFYYSLGAVYIFQDQFGTGEYRLVSTELL